MKSKIHPKLNQVAAICLSCNHKYETRTTTSKIEVEICSNCHPLYTGKQKLIDVAGRVDRFAAKKAAATSTRSAKK